MDTSKAIKIQLIIQYSKCHTSLFIQLAIYILIPNDGANSKLWMPHKDTSLAIQQAIYRSQIKRVILNLFARPGNDYSLAVKSTELFY